MPKAEEKRNGIFSLNGKLINSGEGVVSAQDLALVQGQAVFETLAIYEGRIFAAGRHWKRLSRGAELFGLRNPAASELESGINAVLEANQLSSFKKARARVTLTAGEPEGRFENLPDRTNVIIEVSPAPSYTETASIITVPFARNEQGALCGVKTINYGENVIALRLARDAGADEAVFPNTAGDVCEGSWSNFFCSLDGEMITPPLESGCLPGVTREIILELARDRGIEIQERPLAIKDLNRVEAAALTSTLREIQPVRQIDGRPLSDQSLILWAQLTEAYQDLVRKS
ncbi:aminotransferase class IV [Verrucomicrobiales bacterium BCK34]|nr:aminotransferase class IV [Verrucomicrobiales bacterium BCK34]